MLISTAHLKLATVAFGAAVAIIGSVFVDNRLRSLADSSKATEGQIVKLRNIAIRIGSARSQYLRSHDIVDILALQGRPVDDRKRQLYDLVLSVRLKELAEEACESADISDVPLSVIINRCSPAAKSAFRVAWNGLSTAVFSARESAFAIASSYNAKVAKNIAALEKREIAAEESQKASATKAAFWQRIQVLLTGLGIIIALAKDLIPEKEVRGKHRLARPRPA